jgi:hypothetical protein
MAVENRTINLIPWTETEIPMATPPTRVFPRYTDLNDWQDMGTRAMLLDQTATFSGWKGALYVYGQYSLGTGIQLELSVENPHETGIPTPYIMTNRILLSHTWTEDNADELPGGANYDPNTFVNAPVKKLWHTGTGGSVGSPPGGFYWQPWGGVNFFYYVKSTDTDTFIVYNVTGATVHFVFSTWIWESD